MSKSEWTVIEGYVPNNFSTQHKELISLLNIINQKLDNLDSKVDYLDSKVDQLDSKVDQLDQKITNFGEKITNFGENISSIDSEFQKHHHDFETLIESHHVMVQDLKTLRFDQESIIKSLINESGDPKKSVETVTQLKTLFPFIYDEKYTSMRNFNRQIRNHVVAPFMPSHVDPSNSPI
jgi:outer membrane murein-binding lipoprotein Lpp